MPDFRPVGQGQAGRRKTECDRASAGGRVPNNRRCGVGGAAEGV